MDSVAEVLWSGDNLEVTVTYTGELMGDLTGVAESQFELATDNDPVSPNSISSPAINQLILTFNNYSVQNDTKELTYNEDDEAGNRLKDSEGEDVKSPDQIDVTIPSKED